jgi:streptogramin lyase
MRGRPRILAGVGALLVAAVLAIVLLSGGGGDDKQTATQATTTAPPRRSLPPSVADAPIRVGTRPNALTVAGGRVWALSGGAGELDTIDPQKYDVIRRPLIGAGGTSLTGGFDSVWVLKGGKARTLQRRSIKTGGRVGAIAQIAYPGEPVQVVAGLGALWVGVRTRGAGFGDDETVVKVNPSTPEQQAILIPGGVQDLTVGAGALWVSNRFRNSVVRVDARTGVQREIGLSGKPGGIAVGSGAVWVATQGDDTITRISPRGTQVTAIDVPSIPTRIAVGGGSVWATALEAGRLLRIDPVRRRLIERIDMGARPFALDVEHGKAVWVTLLSRGAVQRVRFAR